MRACVGGNAEYQIEKLPLSENRYLFFRHRGTGEASRHVPHLNLAFLGGGFAE